MSHMSASFTRFAIVDFDLDLDVAPDVDDFVCNTISRTP